MLSMLGKLVFKHHLHFALFATKNNWQTGVKVNWTMVTISRRIIFDLHTYIIELFAISVNIN